MLNFRNDYSSAAHPVVMDALIHADFQQTPGYGADPFCQEAADNIRALCNCPGGAVHFLVGGTQVNKTAIAAFLRPYEAVIAASTAHICCHETGAVEQDGHKIIACPAPEGKLTPDMVRSVVSSHDSEHTVLPRLLYVSNTTELGTVYSLPELQALRRVADELKLYLYCDGARLGSAIAAGDAALPDYAALCDAFTIGGTKNGLLFGEALVIANPALQPGFRHCMKQQGAILAKGQLLGIQFNAILEDGRYFQLAAEANRLARRLTEGLRERNVPFLADSPSNQVFPILPDKVVKALAKEVAFEVQQRVDESHTCIRFVTAWDTGSDAVEQLLALLGRLLG